MAWVGLTFYALHFPAIMTALTAGEKAAAVSAAAAADAGLGCECRYGWGWAVSWGRACALLLL